uniref:Uncharacterized protein n=1 Tax=Pipistrellus kuhlii TaxID=59472 RepID=A0A7J7TW14_PIPKU|nr:hypothetical protein mPipKuh1_009262 [Pipistrellus kuhlii]
MASPLTATHTRALDMDNQLLGPGPPHVGDPPAVRPATAKDTLAIQVDSLALPMTGLDPLQDNTMGLAMASHETVLHTLAPMEGTEPSMGTLRTPRDTQTLMQEQARDIVIDAPQTPLGIMQTHPLGVPTAHPVGRPDRAQEEDTSPSMASPLTATHTRALDMDNQLLGPGPPHVGDPPAVRPATAKDTLAIQVDSLALPMTGLDPLQDNTMGLAKASHETVLHTLAPMEGTEPSMGTLRTLRDTQTLMQEQARDIVIDAPQTPLGIMQTHPLGVPTAHPVGRPDRAQEEDTSPSMASPLTAVTATHTRALDMDNQLLGPGPPHVKDPLTVRPVTAKDTLAIQVDSLALPMTGLDPLQDNTMGLAMASHETVLHTQAPREGTEPSMGTLRTPRDNQTLMQEQARDIVIDAPQTPLGIMQTHPLGVLTAHPVGRPDRAQEEDTSPSMASPLTAMTATHTRALDMDNQLLGPGPPHVGDPPAVRPATAKDTLAIQVDSLALPMTGLDPLQDNTMGLAKASHETVLHTLAPMEGTEPSMGTLRTPRDTQTLM